MTGGAVVAAAAAARARRLQSILDSFRLAGATSPERARTLDQLGVGRDGQLEDLIEASVIVAAPSGGGWYLSESAYVARRDSATGRLRRRLVFVAILAVLAAVLAVLFFVLDSSRML
jgi:hypothetical protein